MIDSVVQVVNLLKMYYGNGYFLWMMLVSCFYLFIKDKDCRKTLIVPMGVILCIVLNPFVIKVLATKISYWRMLWMMPTSVLNALAITKLLCSFKKNIYKYVVAISIVICTLYLGSNVYMNGEYNTLQNIEKISVQAKVICDDILKEEEKPKCIMPQSLYCEVRQYSGDIELFYGRNAQGYITGGFDQELYEEQYMVYHLMESENPDYNYILNVARNCGYHFVVVYKSKEIPQDILNEYQYTELKQEKEYIIYYGKNSA